MRLVGGALAAMAVLSGCAQDTAIRPDLSVILADRPAETLRAYGLFKDQQAEQPADGVVAYDLINPLFSDHAEKDRYVFVPMGETATYQPDEVFEFPVGSVLIKSFSYEETGTIETRLLIHKSKGWVAYPYVWNAERTDAHYAPIGAKQSLDIVEPGTGDAITIAYSVPNQNQCKTCHQAGDALTPIGPKARNLDHIGPNGRFQVADWTERGVLSGAPQDISAVPAIEDAAADIALRARAYLDIN
ncbi:MAG: hypothetical protein AAGJ50_10515, partial [Pseudomonadota bacterium]